MFSNAPERAYFCLGASASAILRQRPSRLAPPRTNKNARKYLRSSTCGRLIALNSPYSSRSRRSIWRSSERIPANSMACSSVILPALK